MISRLLINFLTLVAEQSLEVFIIRIFMLGLIDRTFYFRTFFTAPFYFWFLCVGEKNSRSVPSFRKLRNVGHLATSRQLAKDRFAFWWKVMAKHFLLSKDWKAQCVIKNWNGWPGFDPKNRFFSWGWLATFHESLLFQKNWVTALRKRIKI